MLALSIKSPWAELIANGKKIVENRTWVDGKVLGKRIAIHRCGRGGAIIATAVVQRMTNWEFAWVDYPDQRQYLGNKYVWVLTKIKKLKEELPCKGQLRLWQVPAEYNRKLEKGVKNGRK